LTYWSAIPRLAPAAELDHRLQVVDLFGRHPDQVVHDLGLDLQAGILDQLDHLLGIFLFQPIPDRHLLADHFPALVRFLFQIEDQRVQPLLHRPADQHVDDLFDLHIAFRFEVDLHVLFVQVDLNGRVLEVKPVGDLFFGDIDSIVQDLLVYLAYDIKGWHSVGVIRQSYRKKASNWHYPRPSPCSALHLLHHSFYVPPDIPFQGFTEIPGEGHGDLAGITAVVERRIGLLEIDVSVRFGWYRGSPVPPA
jgi:hypothetical protein